MSDHEPDERRRHVPGPARGSGEVPTDPIPMPAVAPPTIPVPGPPPSAAPPSRPPRGFTHVEVRVLVAICAALAVVGALLVVVAATKDDDPVAATSTTSTVRPTTTSSSTSTSTSTTTTLPPIDSGADARLTGRVRDAVEAALPGGRALVTGASTNLLGNLKIDTTLGRSRTDAQHAFTICQAGKSLGYADVEVRSERGSNLASTGVFDNSCKGHG